MKLFYKIGKELPMNEFIGDLSEKEKTIKRLMYTYTYEIEANESQKTIQLNFNFYSLFKVSIFGGIFVCLLPVLGLITYQTEILERVLEVLIMFLVSSSFLFFASRHYEINQTIAKSIR